METEQELKAEQDRLAAEQKEQEAKKAEDKKPETGTQTPEQLQKQIEELTRHSKNKEEEAARVQKKLEKFEKDEADRKKLEMSEIDRLKLEKQEAEEEARKSKKELADERVKTSVLAEAGKAQFGEKKLKFADPDDAYVFLTDEEKSGNLLEALQKLATKKPHLLAQPAVNGDGVGTGKKGNKSNEQVAATYPKSRY